MHSSSSLAEWASPARNAAATVTISSPPRVRRRPDLDFPRPGEPGISDPPASLFSRHQAVIADVIRLVARRGRLGREDAEDFGGTVVLRLLEHDCAVLRRFEGRSSLRTYLVRVVQRMLLDCRIRQWGKWRPSAHARRLGRVAILLEGLITRDHLSFVEAAECVRTTYGVAATETELWKLYTLLPARARRRTVALTELQHVAAAAPDPAELPAPDEVSRTMLALRRGVRELAPEDRMLLQLRFTRGLRMVRIAQLHGYHQKDLYRRFTGILRALKRSMERQGVIVGDVDLLLTSLNCGGGHGAVLPFRK